MSVETSEWPSLEVIQAGRNAVKAEWRMLGACAEHIEDRRTSAEETQSPDRTYRESGGLDATDASMLTMLPATGGKPQWRDTSVDSLRDELPLLLDR